MTRPGQYDDQETLSFTVTGNSASAISALTANRISPQVAEQEIVFVCAASDADSDQILYRFLLSGPDTGNVYRQMTGWQTANYWTWRTSIYDIGSNTIKVQVRDGKHAGPGSYDAETTLAFTISG